MTDPIHSVKKTKIDETTSICHNDQSETNNELRRKQPIGGFKYGSYMDGLDFSSLYPAVNVCIGRNCMEEVEKNKIKVDDIDMDKKIGIKQTKLVVYQKNTSNVVAEINNDLDTTCMTILALWYPREYFSTLITDNIRIEIKGVTEFDFDYMYSTSSSYRFCEKDIELVISQTGCNMEKAIRSLLENDGDLVNAIMSLAD